MADILIILWVPITIAFMAVAFVVTLSTADGTAPERAVAGRSPSRQDERGR